MEMLGKEKQEFYLKMLITGRSGTGKSSLAGTAPKPLVLLSERQGYNSIVESAARHGNDSPAVMLMTGLSGYRQVFAAIAKRGTDAGKPFQVTDAKGKVIYESAEWPETLIFDSLSDALHLLWDELQREVKIDVGADGIPAIGPRHWGELKTRGTRLIRAARDLPIHVLFLCLLEEHTESVGGIDQTVYGLQAPSKSLVNPIKQACNFAGLSRRTASKQKDGSYDESFSVLFQGPDAYPIKSHSALGAVEEPNVQKWIESIRKGRE